MKIIPPWFRIHLSTALVLMVAASAILGLNLTEGQTRVREVVPVHGYGWPRLCLGQVYDEDLWYWSYDSLVIDVLTAIVLLSVLVIVLEKRIAILQRLKK